MAKPRPQDKVEADMTPMIDMTFQLIAFFMVLINFSEADQNQVIKLPQSELAKAPEAPLANPITLHVMRNGNVIMGTDTARAPDLKDLTMLLKREKAGQTSVGKDWKNANIIIRADKEAKTGRVQEVVGVAQNESFENFVLRAKEVVQ